MGDFFKGWRRKFGLLNLLMACAFSTGWIRSLTIRDSIELYSGSFTVQEWASFNGLLSWSKREHGRIIPREKRWRFKWIHNPKGPQAVNYYPDRTRHSNLPWNHLGASVSWSEERAPLQSLYAQLRYSSVVIPLTLLSAYLLLIKPKPRKAKSDNAP
jgi:hypothetical protein